jgi:hypothetical protein
MRLYDKPRKEWFEPVASSLMWGSVDGKTSAVVGAERVLLPFRAQDAPQTSRLEAQWCPAARPRLVGTDLVSVRPAGRALWQTKP